jgi:predicted Zn-dependent peptidase
VLSILVKIVREIKQGVSDDEINRSKSVVKGSILRSMENIDIFAKYNGIECMYGSKIIPYQDIYSKKLARITKKQVNDVIDMYFYKENMVVCILYDKEINKKKIDSLF